VRVFIRKTTYATVVSELANCPAAKAFVAAEFRECVNALLKKRGTRVCALSAHCLRTVGALSAHCACATFCFSLKCVVFDDDFDDQRMMISTIDV
jgi:hypothetical protein